MGVFAPILIKFYANRLYQGYYLETDPDPTAMVIRVELFTHKLSETNTTWHCSAWLLMHDHVTVSAVCRACG